MHSADMLRFVLMLFLTWPGLAWTQAPAPSSAEVLEARQKLTSDPDLHPRKTVRSLKALDNRQKPQSSEEYAWIVLIAKVARILIWGLGAVLLAVLLWNIQKWVQIKGVGGKLPGLPDLPVEVGNLDIRPQSLPEQPGQVAWNLWQQGDQRGALSLLYRAMISRLLHEHAVPIKASSTEGECLSLARQFLPLAQYTYVETLIPAWLTTMYGHQQADRALVQQLCEGLDTVLKAGRMIEGVS